MSHLMLIQTEKNFNSIYLRTASFLGAVCPEDIFFLPKILWPLLDLPVLNAMAIWLTFVKKYQKMTTILGHKATNIYGFMFLGTLHYVSTIFRVILFLCTFFLNSTWLALEGSYYATTLRGSSPAFLAGKKSLGTRISTTTSQPFN